MIEATLRDMGFKLTSVLVRDDFNGRGGSHTFAVTIVRNGQSLQLEYSAGCANRHYTRTLGKSPHDLMRRKGQPIIIPYEAMTIHELEQNKETDPDNPTLTDVMGCFVSDAQCTANGETFEDFADSLGYDKDSREAERIFHVCRDVYFGLVRLVGISGSTGLQELFDLFQDWHDYTHGDDYVEETL